MERATILEGTLVEIVGACLAGFPNEICGLIGGDRARMTKAVQVENVAPAAAGGECGFHMDPTGQLRAMKAFDAEGLELAGIYHSHPSTFPEPSEPDLRLAAYPEAAYLIVSLMDKELPAVRAWRIEDGHATELELVVE